MVTHSFFISIPLHAIHPGTVYLTPATGGTITATNSEVITATPEGTLIDPLYSVSEASYFMYSSALVTLATNGYAGAMVRTDEAIYIRNIISEYSAPQTYWVKGDIEADGSVTFRFPQLIYHNASNPAADRYVALMTPQSNGTGISLQTVEGDCDLIPPIPKSPPISSARLASARLPSHLRLFPKNTSISTGRK